MVRELASKVVVAYIRRMPLDRGKWRLLQAAARFLVVEIEAGVSVRIAHPEDSLESAAVRGWKEHKEAEAFLSLALPGMTIFDVGANLGIYTLMAAKRVGARGVVHAFEPTPRIVKKLQDNIRLNHFSNVIVNQVAVSNTRGTAQFFIHDEDDRSSLAPISGTAISVPLITLDDYVAQQGISHLDLMKLDVEGAEVQVLNGSKRLLSGPRAPTILLEINPTALMQMGSSDVALESLLHDCGYELTTVAQHATYRNVLAVPILSRGNPCGGTAT